MWSDTGNEAYDSQGDVVHRTNLDALNLQGPNMSQSRMIGKKKPVGKEGSVADSAQPHSLASSKLE